MRKTYKPVGQEGLRQGRTYKTGDGYTYVMQYKDDRTGCFSVSQYQFDNGLWWFPNGAFPKNSYASNNTVIQEEVEVEGAPDTIFVNYYTTRAYPHAAFSKEEAIKCADYDVIERAVEYRRVEKPS